MIDLPPPPVPADCDLRDFPFLPLDVVRLRDSRLTAIATGDEFRAAVLLWCASWHQIPAGSLPTDERELAVLAGYGRDLIGWRTVSAQALHGWLEHSDGLMYHTVVVEKATEAWARKQEQRRRTEAARAARAAQQALRQNGKGSVTDHATGSVTESKGQGQGQGQGYSNTASSSPPPPCDPAEADAPAPPGDDGGGANPSPNGQPATPKGHRSRVEGLKIAIIRSSVVSGDALGVIGGFGGNLSRDRKAEWRRDCAGLQVGEVAVIMWLQFSDSPIREPSGFRKARESWKALPIEDRKADARECFAALGIELPPAQGAA